MGKKSRRIRLEKRIILKLVTVGKKSRAPPVFLAKVLQLFRLFCKQFKVVYNYLLAFQVFNASGVVVLW